jgi:hypothetical protein
MSIGGTASRKITGQEIMNASKLNVGSTPIVSGTVGRLLFQGTGNVLQQSANLFWDDANLRLGINGTPTSSLEIFHNPTGINDTIGLTLNSGSTGSTYKAIRFTAGIFGELGTFGVRTNTGEFRWGISSGGYFPTIYSNGAERLRIATTGNVLINTTTDAGFRLDVNGTFRSTEGLFTSSIGGYKLTVSQTGVSQSNTFRVIQLGYTMLDVNTFGVNFMPFPSASGTVSITNWTSVGGFGNTFVAKNSEFTPTGTAIAIPLLRFPNDSAPIVMGSTATANLRGYLTVSGAFNATSGLATGQQILSTLTATANNDILTGLQLTPTYSASTFTGVNYFGLVIGSTTGRSLRFQRDTITVGPFQRNSINAYNGSGQDSLFIQDAHNGAVYIGGGGGEVQLNGSGKVYTGSGNLLVNTTTDAGFRLDVNGTARVVNDISANSRIRLADGTPYIIGTTIGSSANNGINFWFNNGSDFVDDNNVSALAIRYNNGVRFTNTSRYPVTIGANQRAVASAQLEMISTTQGFLPPRMTNAQRTAIVSPAVGLIVYCTDVTEGLWVYKSTGWTFIV